MATHYKGSQIEEAALNSYITLMRASSAVSAITSSHFQVHKITATQFGILESLYFIGDLTQSLIARKILCSKANLSLQLDILEKQRLIKRRFFHPDRRSVTVTITEKGQRFIKPIFAEHLTLVTQAMAGLTSKEQQKLGELCKKLGKAAEQNLTKL